MNQTSRLRVMPAQNLVLHYLLQLQRRQEPGLVQASVRGAHQAGWLLYLPIYVLYFVPQGGEDLRDERRTGWRGVQGGEVGKHRPNFALWAVLLSESKRLPEKKNCKEINSRHVFVFLLLLLTVLTVIWLTSGTGTIVIVTFCLIYLY